MKKTVRVVDPPSGHKYGFPKEVPDHINRNEFRQWLIDEGYPEEEVDFGMMHCRYWAHEVGEDYEE